MTAAGVAVVAGALAIGIGIGQQARIGGPTPWQIGLTVTASGVLLAAIGYTIIRGTCDRDDIISEVREMRAEVSGEVATIGDANAARHVDLSEKLSRIEGGVGASLELRNILTAVPGHGSPGRPADDGEGD